MKRTFKIACFALVIFITQVGFSQQKIKKGLGFGAIPAVSFDSDLGFQYGAVVNLYQYGDGSRFPKYDHSLYMEWSRFSKGTGINRIMYDSERLIPKVRTTVDMTYMTDQMMDFFGYNGYQTIYNDSLSKATRHFYKNERNMFRVKADFQGSFGESKFGWIAGYTFYNFAIDTVNITKLKLDPIQGGTLFQRYVKNGLISTAESDGGSLNYIKLGLKYDSRDQRACPMKGIWTEAVIQTAPGFINEFAHTKFALIHRQYFKLAKDMSLAYRIDYQTTLGNSHVPFYAQPLLITSFLTASTNQGLGGKNSLRGILRNRIVGDAVGFGNFEFRYKFVRFEWLKQNFYVGTNIFFDSGMILKPIAIANNLTSSQKNELFLNSYESSKLHSAAGIGLKIGWNENFIISADYGKAFNKQDGNSGMYIGLNYLF
ncbi:MAG: Omp85 family outer membrane protein [Paludibacter sp.]